MIRHKKRKKLRDPATADARCAKRQRQQENREFAMAVSVEKSFVDLHARRERQQVMTSRQFAKIANFGKDYGMSMAKARELFNERKAS